MCLPYRVQLQAKTTYPTPSGPLSWWCDNELPSGIVLDSDTGVLSGTCQQPFYNSLSFHVKCVKTGEQSAPAVLTPYFCACWTSVLLRDSLLDTNQTPRQKDLPCSSPDIIRAQDGQVPPSDFIKNYAQDPNLPIVPSVPNYLFVRAKNNDTVVAAGDAFLYWCPSTLLPLPSQWSGNAITPPGTFFNQAQAGAVTVAPTPFVWTPPQQVPGKGYTLVAATSTANHPWNIMEIPSFATWQAFADWLYNAPNVCVRSVTMLAATRGKICTRNDLLAYPFTEPTAMLLRLRTVNVPVNTQVMLKNESLGIDVAATVSDSEQTFYSDGATCPAGFSGNIETTAVLADGTSWPNNARIVTTLYLGYVPNEAQRLDKDGRLVAVGSCTTVFTNT